jgi:heterotetrameric sarcosine oxidase gamma subunit
VKLRPRSVFGAEFGVAAGVPGFNGGNRDTRLVERSDIAGVLITAAIDPVVARRELRARVGLDVPLEANAVLQVDRNRILWMTPRSWLVHCSVDEERMLAHKINETFSAKELHAALFTDQLCWLELSGAEALNLLTEGSFVSLEPGGMPIGCAKQTRLADVAVIVLHIDSQSWLLGVERSRGMYLATWLRQVGAHTER